MGAGLDGPGRLQHHGEDVDDGLGLARCGAVGPPDGGQERRELLPADELLAADGLLAAQKLLVHHHVVVLVREGHVR